MLRLLQQDAVPLVTSGALVAQVWRDGGRQANLARMLAGVDVQALDRTVGRRIGELLGRVGSRDVVDAHVALLVSPGGTLLTSDGAELRALLSELGTTASLIDV